MDKAVFTALPVTAGDAFLLQREGMNVLVDGGSSPRELQAMLTAADITRIDVAVATHADRDHAGGLVGIFGSSKWSVGELWVPAFWTWRLGEVVYDDANFLDEVLRDIERLPSKEDADQAVELPREALEGRWSDPFAKVRRSDRDPQGWQATGRGWVLTPSVEEALRARVTERAAQLEGWREELWAQAVEAQRLIRDLLAHAIAARVPIVPLEPVESPTDHASSYRGWPLIGLNSVPSRPRVVPVGALRLMELSRNNEYSLVFLAPESSASPAVLFCADSNFAWWPDPDSYRSYRSHIPDAPEGDLIATAPHHGSASNPRPYELIARWMGPTGTRYDAPRQRHWVRGTSRRVHLAGSAYLSLSPPDFRHCVRCLGSRRAAPVRGESAGAHWVLESSSCSCR